MEEDIEITKDMAITEKEDTRKLQKRMLRKWDLISQKEDLHDFKIKRKMKQLKIKTRI